MSKIDVITLKTDTENGPRWMLVAFDGHCVHEWPLLKRRGLSFPMKREPTESEIEEFSRYVHDPFNVPYPSIAHLRH